MTAADDDLLKLATSFATPDTAAGAAVDRELAARAIKETARLANLMDAAGQGAAKAGDNLTEKAAEVALKLVAVGKQIQTTGQLLQENVKALGDRTESTLKALGELFARAGEAQAKQQLVLIVLTGVLAATTIAYTVMTWQSVQVMREGNAIQRELLEAQRSAAKPRRAD